MNGNKGDYGGLTSGTSLLFNPQFIGAFYTSKTICRSAIRM